MLNVQYTLLCSIVFEHEFYTDRICRDIVTMPTAESVKLLEDYGLLIKNVAGKTMILQKVEGGQAETPFDTVTRLCFFVFLQNPALSNLCDTGGEKRFYLTNLADDGSLRSQLTAQDALSAQDKLPKAMPRRFYFPFKKGEFQQLNIERFEKGGWTSVSTLPVEANAEGMEIKLSQSGKYKVSKDPMPAGEQPQLIMADDEVASSSPFLAVIELFLDSTFAFGTEYIVKIINRAFKWQYVFMDVKSKKVVYGSPNNIQVTFTKHPLDSLSPVPTLFSNKALNTLSLQQQAMISNLKAINQATIEEVFVFESDRALPLLDNRPPVIKFGTNNHTMVMPVPSIDSLQVVDNKAVVFFNI